MFPALIERAREEIALARVVGKFTVTRGVRTLRRRLAAAGHGSTSAAAVEAIATGPDATSTADPTMTTVPDDGVIISTSTTIRSADLVLPDYDHLPAAHVVAKLSSLTQPERDAVEEYESANRHRRTILGKLDQLRTNR